MRNSILSGQGTSPRIGARVRRSSLNMYDLFQRKAGGNLYMHTGQRTRPPSGSTVTVTANDGNKTTSMTVDSFPSLGTNKAGKDVIGYQSVKVAGTISENEDGAVVTYSNDYVLFQGTATVVLPDHL